MRLKNPERLSKRVAVALLNQGNVLGLSAVSLAEIAINTTLGKFRVSAAIARQALEDLDIRVLPFPAEHALDLF